MTVCCGCMMCPWAWREWAKHHAEQRGRRATHALTHWWRCGNVPANMRHLSACVSLSREPLRRPCWRDKRHSLPPSLLPPSLPVSCDSPALWSIPSEGLMMGPSCVREGAGLPLMWSAQQRASLENRRLRWLRWPAACSRTATALDIQGSDYKLATRSREA